MTHPPQMENSNSLFTGGNLEKLADTRHQHGNQIVGTDTPKSLDLQVMKEEEYMRIKEFQSLVGQLQWAQMDIADALKITPNYIYMIMRGEKAPKEGLVSHLKLIVEREVKPPGDPIDDVLQTIKAQIAGAPEQMRPALLEMLKGVMKPWHDMKNPQPKSSKDE